MHHPLPMKVADDLAHLLDQVERLPDRVVVTHEFGHATTVRDVLPDDVGSAIPPPGPLDGDDLWMRECGPQLGGALKLVLPHFACAGPRRKDLEGHGLFERTV